MAGAVYFHHHYCHSVVVVGRLRLSDVLKFYDHHLLDYCYFLVVVVVQDRLP